MKIEDLKEWLCLGHDIEFDYKDCQFSITWGMVNKTKVIGFCEGNKESQNVRSLEELLPLKWNGETVREIWENLTEDDVWH